MSAPEFSILVYTTQNVMPTYLDTRSCEVVFYEFTHPFELGSIVIINDS